MAEPQRIGEFLWQAMPEGREKYQAYLCSREWAEKRRAVMERCEGICERCHENEAQLVHHLTYERKYQENVNDLTAWCEACHAFTHGMSERDPLEAHRTAMAVVRTFATDKELGHTVICPFCGCLNCHMEQPAYVAVDQGGLTIPMWCEGGHRWEVELDGHKGTLSIMVVNGRDAPI